MIATLEYKPHPLAEMFPGMTEEEERELTDDVTKNGLVEDIVLHEGKILDGVHRGRACAASGVKPRYVEFADLAPAIRDAGPLEFVIGKNLMRRHLTTSQRAALAVELEAHYAKEALERRNANLKHVSASGPTAPSMWQKGTKNGETARGRSSEKAAAAMAVSPRSVRLAKRVRARSPEKFEQLKAGTLTVGKASMDQAAVQRMAALEAAHARIEKVCGKALADAARNKTRLRTAREALAFAGQADAEMRSQAGLIEIGWTLAKARKFRAKNLTLRSTLGDLVNRAASEGMSLDVVIDGWRVVVTRATSALKY
jgi:hypothetical protein